MGFFRKLFFGEDKKTKLEKKVEKHTDKYTQEQIQNIKTCDGCGQDITEKPKIMKNAGKILYFHKRCWKAMGRGELPKPILTDEKEEVEE